MIRPVRTSGPSEWVRPSSRERGAGTALVAAALMVVTVACGVGVLVAGWIDSVHRARSAADLSALSAAQVYVLGGDACHTAARAAASNGGVLDSCRVEGDIQSFVVRVKVSVALRPVVPGAPTLAGATAVAGAGAQ